MEGTASRRRGHTTVHAYRVVYESMLKTFCGEWTDYWKEKLTRRGLDQTAVSESLRILPRGTSQVERWDLMEMHMNALVTSARLRFVVNEGGPRSCFLCNSADDSMEHIFSCCDIVRQLRRKVYEGRPQESMRPLGQLQYPL